MAEGARMIRSKLLRWGNSFGFRVSGKEVKSAGIRPGQEVDLRIEPREGAVDLSHLSFFRDGAGVSERHDDYIATALWKEHLKKRARYTRWKGGTGR